MQAVLAVLLATFAGFGGAMCGTSIIFEIIKWRRIWSSWPTSQRDSTQASDTVNVAQMDSQPHQSSQGVGPDT